MTASRRLATLPLQLIGLAVIAALANALWFASAQTPAHAQTPANQGATGRPVILASAEGAPILFADTLGIADGNGLPFSGSVGSNIEFVYSYQWIQVDGGTETNIGADSPSYLLVDADIGNLIKVQVSFTDQDNYSETVTSLPFGPVAEPAGPSRPATTLVSNTDRPASATANITQQYAMEFTLGSHGQGYALPSVSIELAAVPSSLTVSLWIGDHSSQSSVPETKLFDFENPSPFVVGMNKFTAPAGVLAYPSVHYYIVLSDFGSSLSIKETTSDGEHGGGELGDKALVRALNSTGRWGTSSSRDSVLRLAVEGWRRASGILVSTYAQDVADSIDQETISVGDECCFRMGVGAADRYLIRGFSWRSDDSTPAGGGILNPWDLRDGTSSSAAKLFRLINTREVAGINEWTAPQGATVVGGSSKTYTFKQDLSFFDYLGSRTRLGGVLTRIFGTAADGYDAPTAPGVTLSLHGAIEVGSGGGNPLLAVLGVPLYAMVQNLGQTDDGYRGVGSATVKALTQGFTTGPDSDGYPLQGIGVNIEGSDSKFPDGPLSVSVAVHADSGGKPGAKLFDLVSPGLFGAGHSFFEAPPGTTLAPSTSYVVVWSHLGGTVHRLRKTSSHSEGSGALTGFSMANAFYQGVDLDNLAVDTGSDVLEMAVYGRAPRTATCAPTVLASAEDAGVLAVDT
ncbi:choice-of-anchor R domain-containing protein [Candidatus Poriferisodalis sp.]|uniref:choice-of-anchor R domain-containing protein n=1 Tax=Candidatus Poriferisodalis sp. TaxID=3101277 RepID=UPI003C6F8AFC